MPALPFYLRPGLPECRLAAMTGCQSPDMDANVYGISFNFTPFKVQ